MEVHLHECQRERVAERHELAGALRRLDRRDPGDRERIALRQRAQTGRGGFGHADVAPGYGPPSRERLAADVHHPHLARGLVDVRQLVHRMLLPVLETEVRITGAS